MCLVASIAATSITCLEDNRENCPPTLISIRDIEVCLYNDEIDVQELNIRCGDVEE